VAHQYGCVCGSYRAYLDLILIKIKDFFIFFSSCRKAVKKEKKIKKPKGLPAEVGWIAAPNNSDGC